MKRRFAASILLPFTMLAGCDDQHARIPNRENFTAMVNDFLAQRGHVCVGKYDWPVTVTAGSHAADAAQMPVLEKAGLVDGKPVSVSRTDHARSDAPGPAAEAVPAREYALSAEGQRYYLRSPVVIRTATRSLSHPADLCAATLSLDRLIGWDPPRTRDGRTGTSVLFTYRIALAPWASAPDVRRAFPMLARAIEGERTLQVRVGAHLTPHGWVADELDER